MDLDEMLATPNGVGAWRLDETTLLALAPELSTRIRQLEVLRVRLVHEIDERCVAQTVGAASTQAWLSGTCMLTPGQATKIITAGRSLIGRRRHRRRVQRRRRGHRPGPHHHVTAGSDPRPALRRPPTVVEGEVIDPVAACTQQCTDYLVASAEHATHTANRAAALKTMLEKDQDGPPPDDENEQLNQFFASPTTGGRVRVKGHFDKTTGEQLLTALSALSKPQPGRNNTHGESDPDPRTAPQRRADAFADIIHHYLASGHAPGEGGEKPHMTVFVNLNDLAHATPTTGAENPTTGTGTDTDTRAGAGTNDARSPSHESGDTRCGTGDCNGTCGSDTCPLAQSVANITGPGRSFIRRGPAWMPWLGPISARLAALLSCDATVTSIVMDDDRNPLDVGTTTRTILRRIRRALDARDCGCAFPDCGRPAAWTDGHHIRHWSNGGPTKLSNLVLLCRFHHRLIHKGEWEVFISTDDSHPWFIPPRWLDPGREPVPAHNRRQLVHTT